MEPLSDVLVATPNIAVDPVWATVALALIAAMQAVCTTYFTRKVDQSTQKTRGAVDELEKKINSNMEREISQAISEALAKERMSVMAVGQAISEAIAKERMSVAAASAITTPPTGEGVKF